MSKVTVPADVDVNGTLLTGHDALYRWSPQLKAGAGTPDELTTNGVHRWGMDVGDSLLAWFEIPVRWGSYQARLFWTKEAVGNGNASFQLGYRATTFADSNVFNAKTLTPVRTVAVPAGVGDRGYITDLTPEVTISLGAFIGDAPLIAFEVTRVAAGDTYVAGQVSVMGLFLQRLAGL